MSKNRCGGPEQSSEAAVRPGAGARLGPAHPIPRRRLCERLGVSGAAEKTGRRKGPKGSCQVARC